MLEGLREIHRVNALGLRTMSQVCMTGNVYFILYTLYLHHPRFVSFTILAMAMKKMLNQKCLQPVVVNKS